MPQAVISGNLSLYADDTTVHCIGSTVDKACNQLNNALDELNKWCMTNSLTPHSPKCQVTLLHRGAFIGPYSLIIIGNVDVAWVCHARLLGITTDNVNVAEVCHARLLGITVDWKLTFTKHLTELRTLSLNWIYLKIALSQRGNLSLTYIFRWFSLLWQTTSLSGETVTIRSR